MRVIGFVAAVFGGGDCPPYAFGVLVRNGGTKEMSVADLKTQSPPLAITLRAPFWRKTRRRLRFGAGVTSRSVPTFKYSGTQCFAGQSPLPKTATTNATNRSRQSPNTEYRLLITAYGSSTSGRFMSARMCRRFAS